MVSETITVVQFKQGNIWLKNLALDFTLDVCEALQFVEYGQAERVAKEVGLFLGKPLQVCNVTPGPWLQVKPK